MKLNNQNSISEKKHPEVFFIKTLLRWHRVDVFDQIRFLVMWQQEQLTLNLN